MLTKNLKTASFFVLIALLCAAPAFHKKLKKGRELVQAEGENARELYTGKTRDVYDPLDDAYVVTDTLKEMMKNEESMDFSHYKILPVVSIWVDPRDLYDESRGIFHNFLKKGRLWERASYISYYEKGEKKFSSFAGVRIHGGGSRIADIKSLRFNFRNKYGEPYFITDDFQTKSIIVRREGTYAFANDFSYEVIRRTGGMAPKIRYVAAYLNGKFYSNMHLVEHQNKEGFEKVLGHKKFIYHKLKGDNNGADRLLYESAIHKIKAYKGEKLVSHVRNEYDLDNLIPWYLMVTYLGMHDWVQGIWFKDLKESQAKWRLIGWDFDMAFLNGYDRSKKAWEIDGVESLSNMYVASLQGTLFRAMYKTPALKQMMRDRLDSFCKILGETFLEKMSEYMLLSTEYSNQDWTKESLEHYRNFFQHKKCLEII